MSGPWFQALPNISNPQDIIGKQICLLANLAPREIKGIQSQGMILLAEDASGKLIFVTPEEGMKPGAEVK